MKFIMRLFCVGLFLLLTNIFPGASAPHQAQALSSCLSSWQLAMTIVDHGQGSATLTIGQGAAASNGLDDCYGEALLPPPPPAGSFDARLTFPSGTQESLIDLRPTGQAEIFWTMKFQPGSGGYPFTITWNAAGLPAGSFRLKDILGGIVVNVDMKAQGYYTVSNSGITSLDIEFTPNIPTCLATWQKSITVADHGQGSATLTIGQGPAASTGLDTCYGEALLPPPPPAGSYDARLTFPDGIQESLIDFRPTSQTQITWKLKFQPGSGGYPFTISWKPAGLPTGSFRLKDTLGGILINVNMKTQGSYTVSSSGIASLIIEYTQYNHTIFLPVLTR